MYEWTTAHEDSYWYQQDPDAFLMCRPGGRHPDQDDLPDEISEEEQRWIDIIAAEEELEFLSGFAEQERLKEERAEKGLMP